MNEVRWYPAQPGTDLFIEGTTMAVSVNENGEVCYQVSKDEPPIEIGLVPVATEHVSESTEHAKETKKCTTSNSE